MKLKIEITMDNAAFGDSEGGHAYEAGRILESIAQDMRAGLVLTAKGDHESLLDLNGNHVGEAKVTR